MRDPSYRRGMIHSSIYLALAGAFFTALSLIYTSGLLKKHGELSPNVSVLFTYLVASVMLCVLVDITALMHALSQPDIMWYIIAASALLFLSRILYTYAYKHIDAGYVTLFSSFTPIYTVATAWWMLHTLPSADQLLGIFFITTSVLVIFWQPMRPGKPHYRAYVAAFLSTIPAAISIIFQKKALAVISPVHLTFASFVLITGFSLAYAIITSKKIPLGSLYKQGLAHHRLWLLIGILTASAHICFFYVVEQHHAAAAQAAQRSSILFQILLAYVLLNEKNNIIMKLAGGIIALASITLLLG